MPEVNEVWVLRPWLRGGESMLRGVTFKCGQAGMDGHAHVLEPVLLRAVHMVLRSLGPHAEPWCPAD